MKASKSRVFAKRTCKYLYPFFISIAILRLAFPDSSSVFSIPFSASNFHIPSDSARFLSMDLAKTNILPDQVIDLGSTLQFKSNETTYSIDQENPYNSFIFDPKHQYRKGVIGEAKGDSKNLDSNLKLTKSESKYTLSKTDFEKSYVKDKGDLNLVLDLNISLKDSQLTSIPIVTSIDMHKLFYQNDYSHELFSLQTNETNPNKYNLKFQKEASSFDLTFQLEKPQNPQEVVEDVEVKEFYVLFTNNPSLNYNTLFSTSDSTAIATDQLSTAFKKVHLDNWEKSDYTYSPDSQDFWTSRCWDPYKIGGFIDQEPTKSSEDQKSTNSDKSKSKSKSYIQQQLSVQKKFNPLDKKEQWQSPSQDAKYYPTKNYTTAAPCVDMDEETKKKFKEYYDNQKNLEREKDSTINKSLTPQPISELLNNSQNKTKKSKVVQASFRAWGGVYNIAEHNGGTLNVKAGDLYNPRYEAALRTKHTFSVKISKENVINKLIDHNKLKSDLSQISEVSSIIHVTIPFSFQVYDPIANYLRKEKVILHVDLDLRSIYNQSYFSKDFYIYDLNIKHGIIGRDYGGLEYSKSGRDKNYGMSGILIFSAGLEVDVEKNLKVNLSATTKGLVSTKNATCDLRDRLYKYKNNENDKKCTQSTGWKFREHIHIPPFIVINIDSDPSVSSFYIDRRVSKTSSSTQSSGSNKVTKLSELKTDLDSREIKKTYVFPKDDNGEVYFEKISASDQSTWDFPSSSDSKHIAPYSDYLTTTTTTYWYTYYYYPRVNETSLYVDDFENLDSIDLHLEGASQLSGHFFKTMHYNTQVSYCSTQTSSDQNCVEFWQQQQQQQTISKDQDAHTINSKFTNLKIKWQKQQQTYDFLTILHYEKDKLKLSTESTKLTYLFSVSDSDSNVRTPQSNSQPSQPSQTQHVPQVSMVGVWYSISIDKDQTNKKIKFTTKVRPISVISHVKDWKNSAAENQTSQNLVGSMARAGFQLWKAELTYKKKT